MEQLKVVYRSIKDLKPYENNAKKHPKAQVEQIAQSIKEFGFVQPVIVDKNNVVVAGHGRILGAKKAGLKKVPTVQLESLTEAKIKAYRLADNKLNESDWDLDLLEIELDDLLEDSDLDMSLFGFDLDLEEDEPETKKVEFEVKEKHVVIVHCKDEQETFDLQVKLTNEGYVCDAKNT